MQNLSASQAIAGQLDESLYWARRSWPLTAKAPNDFFHISFPLLPMRADELSRRWLAEAAPAHRAHARDPGRVSRRHDRRARAGTSAQEFPGNQEVAFLLYDLAVLAGANDALALNEIAFRTSPDVTGVVLPESSRLRYAFLLQQRGDARARRLIEEAAAGARARIAAGDVASNRFMDVAAAAALQGDTKGPLSELQRAYDNGWRDYGIASIDPMLSSLRDHPDFRALVDRTRRDVAAQRDQARARGLLDLSGLIGRPLP
jgi:hypothetical protein